MKGKLRTLMSRELVGDSSNQAVYPITSVRGVIDENNTDLKTIHYCPRKSFNNLLKLL